LVILFVLGVGVGEGFVTPHAIPTEAAHPEPVNLPPTQSQLAGGLGDGEVILNPAFSIIFASLLGFKLTPLFDTTAVPANTVTIKKPMAIKLKGSMKPLLKRKIPPRLGIVNYHICTIIFKKFLLLLTGYILLTPLKFDSGSFMQYDQISNYGNLFGDI
jgi:hypothetical protein